MNQILIYCVLVKSLELSQRQQLSIMQQFGASAFYTVVHWHKQGEVESKCILHISVVLAICLPKIIKFGGNLTKFWQKKVGSFFGTPYTSTTTPTTTTTPTLQLRGKGGKGGKKGRSNPLSSDQKFWLRPWTKRKYCGKCCPTAKTCNCRLLLTPGEHKSRPSIWWLFFLCYNHRGRSSTTQMKWTE